MGVLNDHPVATAVAVIIAAWLIRFVITSVKHRRLYGKLPGPPHHPIFGHLISLGKVTSGRLPNRVHPHVFAHYLTKEYDLPPVFYLDLYPVSLSMLIILDPDIAQEVANSGLPKHPAMADTIAPLAGRVNMLLTHGDLWKKWRACFNPGFSLQHLMNQVPAIVGIAEDYVRVLDQHAAKNEPFRLEEAATRATIDIIGKVVCDHDFKCLTTRNDFNEAMRSILSWEPDGQSLNPFHRYHPIRPLAFKYYKRQMDKYIGKILDERFLARDASLPRKTRKKTSIDLALEEYFKESGKDIDSRTATMDAEFRQHAIDNLLILLFAGHDTTSSTVCYCYHLLSKHPDKHAKIRQELDDVFGVGVNAAERLKQDPYLINKCDYTLAVIKEANRMWSPASGIRQGRADYFVKDPVTGNQLPTTEDMIIWPVVISMHRDERLWGPDAQDFNPERFLPPLSDKVNPNAYRPFERGPRNCIGQELALIEMKVILALTVREFDIRAAYDELESLSKDGSIWATEMGQKRGVQECFGDEAYQVLMASAKPREGMPARVKRRQGGEKQ